jgi:hypothetical protein
MSNSKDVGAVVEQEERFTAGTIERVRGGELTIADTGLFTRTTNPDAIRTLRGVTISLGFSGNIRVVVVKRGGRVIGLEFEPFA